MRYLATNLVLQGCANMTLSLLRKPRACAIRDVSSRHLTVKSVQQCPHSHYVIAQQSTLGSRGTFPIKIRGNTPSAFKGFNFLTNKNSNINYNFQLKTLRNKLNELQVKSSNLEKNWVTRLTSNASCPKSRNKAMDGGRSCGRSCVVFRGWAAGRGGVCHCGAGKPWARAACECLTL